MLYDQRSGIGKEIEGVRHQIVEVCGKDYTERSALKSNLLSQDGISKPWELAIARAFNFALAFSRKWKEPFNERAIERGWIHGVILRKFLLG